MTDVDDNAPPPAVCLDCGMPYSEFPLDVLLPRPQWLEIHPDENGLLCAACIVRRCARIPGVTACHLIVEIAPHTQAAKQLAARGGRARAKRLDSETRHDIAYRAAAARWLKPKRHCDDTPER